MNGVSATINLLFTRSANMYAIQLISPNPTNANKNTITGLTPGKKCYIYVIAYWQARGIAAENKPWQLNVSGAENISVLHANYRNLYGEAGGTDAWAVLNVKSTADTITVVSLNQSINQWPMVCVVQ